jgi:hypothetical protein
MSTPFDQLPLTRASRPYLPRIAYAPDDQGSVRERLIARLSQAVPGWNPELAQDGSDYGVLLTELFAHMAAILHAYTDQRANEGFLRTATQTRSLMDLAQLIDYRLGQGASATVLQAFIAKADKSGRLPAGFKLNALPGANAPALVFETGTSLEVHPSRNTMRLVGYNRSGRVLHLRPAVGDVQDVSVLLDAAYTGLRAGVPVVFDDGATLTALPPAAITEAGGVTQLAWARGIAGVSLDLLIVDLTLHGRPQQSAKLAAAGRADEITLGQNQLPVANALMFTKGGAVLIDSAGLQMAATVLDKNIIAGQSPAGTITLNRGVTASLRRSVTRVLEGTSCGYWTTPVSAGTTILVRTSFSDKKKDFPHTPDPGDILLIVDASGIEIATVASADGILISLTAPLGRALRPTSHLFDPDPSIRYFCLKVNDPTTHQTTVRPVLLGELSGVYQSGNTVLALDKSVDAFAVGNVVALGDGKTFSAHGIVNTESVNGRSVLTLAGSAPEALQVALLSVYGAFANHMHVSGFDYSEATLAAGASQLDISGAPKDLAGGLDLVISDGTHVEGARITQVLPADDHVQISLARPLDFAYTLGDAVVYGNVAPLTHGASAPDEVLGSGDPSVAPQRFELRRFPLAWVPDPTASRGVAPDVEVFVGGERWTRVDTLADSGPLDRHMVIETDEREHADVVFGDGVNGAAPPSGRNNIIARYRAGHGANANVAALAINKMPQAAAFLEKTFNPVAASGGADRETSQQARTQATLRIHTLDRAVSLTDYADLALTFAGVGKALAAVELEGRGAGARRVIVVTCAASGGNALSTPQKEALLAFLMARSPEPERVRVRDHRPWPVRLALTVNVLADYQQVTVQRALLAAFGNAGGGYFNFEERALGTDLALSDIYALAEATTGVDNVLTTLFHAEGDSPQVLDRISIPVDALATGGDCDDAAIGRLTVQLIGGLS